jgi:hypothetical protein
LGNIVISGDNITGTNGQVLVNSAGADINLIVSGDTIANLLVVDAGSDTVLIATGTPTTGAALKIGTTNSILIPVGNTAQRPGTSVTGMLRFNTTLDVLEFYDNDSWVPATSEFTVITADSFVGNGVATTFTLSTASTTAGTVVAINGVVQIPTTAYSVSSTTLTFTEAPDVNDVIDARIFTTTTSVTSISNGTSIIQIPSINGNATIDIAGTTVQTVSPGLVAITGDLSVSGNATLSGNILGDRVQNGTTSLDIQTLNGNANITVGGTSNVAVFSTTGAFITGLVSVTGAVTAASVVGGVITGSSTSVTGTTTAASVVGGVITGTSTSVSGTTTAASVVGGVITGSSVSVTGNITGSYMLGNGSQLTGIDATSIQSGTSNVRVVSSNGNIAVAVGGSGIVTFTSAGIINNMGNAVGNIGNATSGFNTIFAKATSAQYADLAEMYEADGIIEPGTVVCFGGTKEITLCREDACRKIAGVVSTNPSYLMNSGQTGDYVVPVALQGRVPVRVIGPVQKGDMMVATHNGRARAEANPVVGSVIGKALADFDGQDGVIEVVVGRV